MEIDNEKVVRNLAESVMNDLIVSASEYITVPGNTVDGFVNGLIENFVDTKYMSEDDVILLRKFLHAAAQTEIDAGKQ